MRKINSDEELMEIHRKGVGLVYNDFSGRGTGGKHNNVLHSAYCNWVTVSKTNYRKYFFNDINEATDWLNKNRGPENQNWKRCGTCKAIIKTPGRETVDIKITAEEKFLESIEKEPFTEAEVEGMLVDYLLKEGYQIKRHVPVSSGIIDVVANKGNETIIIEVKGEDKGGFGTAQMNFQMGIGQILSRMDDKSARYALAVPVTPNFKSIFRSYRDSFGFTSLGLYVYLIYRDGKVEMQSPENFSKWIQGL